jgi:plastocyanin
MIATKVSPRALIIAAVLAVAGLALLLAAPWQGIAAASGTASASKTAVVDIANFAFHPPTLRVGKGSKVTFANSSKVSHTATKGGSFDTRVIKPGRSFTVRFGQKGTFAYHCEIHPSMHGKIVVE